MVQFNPAVQEGIRRWLTDMRVQLLTSYENYQYMRPQMWPNFEKAGLPEALLFGILAAIMWVTRKVDWYEIGSGLR